MVSEEWLNTTLANFLLLGIKGELGEDLQNKLEEIRKTGKNNSKNMADIIKEAIKFSNSTDQKIIRIENRLKNKQKIKQ